MKWKRFEIMVAGFSLLALTACAQREQAELSKPAGSKPSLHRGDGGSDSNEPKGFVGIVAKQKLAISPDRAIGPAFEAYRYFSSRQWRESKNPAGKVYVDFTGLLSDTSVMKSVKSGVVRQGVGVKFVVEPNGKFYVGMVSRIDVTSDGNMQYYPLEDAKTYLEMIYANKEIKFQ